MIEATRATRNGVTLVGATAHGVTFGFTERTGGVSAVPYASLNLGSHVGDDPAAVEENRRRVLAALDVEELLLRLLVPNQVHGDHVACVRSPDPEALDELRRELASGTDAVVCVTPDVPVMLCFADCVPVILVCPGGFAVVHSGWKGTYARIAARAAGVLAREAGVSPRAIEAFIGPHIRGDEYEVSQELKDQFVAEFPVLAAPSAGPHDRFLNLALAIRSALEEAGLAPEAVHDLGLSTLSSPERFFSYRGEAGRCGRHGAVAVMRKKASE